MILYNEFEPFSKLVNSEFYNDFKTFSKLVHENGNGNENVSTNKILGSLEILAIKKQYLYLPKFILFKGTDKQAYIAEIGKLKEMIRACDEKPPGSNRGDGIISVEEGQQCLTSFVSFE